MLNFIVKSLLVCLVRDLVLAVCVKCSFSGMWYSTSKQINHEIFMVLIFLPWTSTGFQKLQVVNFRQIKRYPEGLATLRQFPADYLICPRAQLDRAMFEMK